METTRFEFASTITLALQANRVTTVLVKKIYADNLGNYMAQYSLAVPLHISEKKTSSEPCQTPKTELFAKIKKTVFSESSNLDV